MTTESEPSPPTRLDPIQPDSAARLLVVPALAGCLVALTLGLYGRLHSPTGVAVDVIGFSSPATVKAWLASGALLFAVVQFVT